MKNDEMKGFTLLETLIGMLLLIASTYFFSVVLAQTKELFHPERAQNYYEWQTFLLQMEQELKDKTDCQVTNNCLTVKESNDNGTQSTVSFEWYRKKVRKRRDGMGHHVLLTKVEKWDIHEESGIVVMRVVFSDGHHYTGRVVIHEKS